MGMRALTLSPLPEGEGIRLRDRPRFPASRRSSTGTAYRELFTVRMDPERISEIRHATNGYYALGSERFKAEIEQALRHRAPHRKRVGGQYEDWC